MDWQGLAEAVFGSASNDITPVQMSARALLVLAYGLLLVRLFGRRIFGRWTPLDVIISVLIGSNLSRTLTGNAPLLSTLVSTTVLVGLYWTLAHLSLQINWVSWLVKGRQAKLIEDGRVDWDEMRRQGLGPRDLDEALHSSGVQNPGEVQEAWLERNGEISVLKR